MRCRAYVLGMLFSSTAFCNTASDALQSRLQAIHSMSASFQQVVRVKQREMSRSSGTMALLRPGRFRWQTIRPMKQWVIADGQHLWVYDVELLQVSVKRQDDHLGGTAALFLSGGQDNVARDFDVTTYRQGSKDVFDLHAKSSKAHFERVLLSFVGAVLQEIALFDPLGQHTVVTLSHIKMNQNVAASLFQFKPPPGVDVVPQ